MRRSIAAVTAVLALGATAALPTASADPAACAGEDSPRPFPAPDGTTFVVHNAAGDDASTLTSPVLSGDLPDGCVVDGLGYDRTDGYLYGLHGQSIVQIGRGPAGDVATKVVGVLPGAPLVADIDRSGNYVTLGVNPLTRTAAVQSYPDLRTPVAGVSILEWASSCRPLLNNYQAQARLRIKDPALPPPEALIQDWAYNPADDGFYAYAAVDTHDAYLGKTEPIAKWTIAPLPDQLIRIDMDDSTARCAAVSNPHPPGGIDRGVIGDTFGSNATHGTAAIAGAAFTRQDQLTLFQLAQGQQWILDVASCFAPAGCLPEPGGSTPEGRGDAAGNPYQPSRVTVETIISGGDKQPAPRRQRFSFPSNDLDPDGFALGPGESRTFDLAPGEVELAQAPEVTGWQLKHTGCRAANSLDGPRDKPGPMRVVLRPGEQLVCTYAATFLTTTASPSASAAASTHRKQKRGESTAAGKTADKRPEVEFSLPWSGQTAVSLPGTAPTATLAAMLILALGIGGGVFVLFPRRRRPLPPRYKARHRA